MYEYDDFGFPNSQPQDDNPSAGSQSLPTANGGGFAQSASQFLDKLLTYNLQKDEAQYRSDLLAKGYAVNSPMATPILIGANGQVNVASLIKIGVGVLVLVGAVIAVKKLA